MTLSATLIGGGSFSLFDTLFILLIAEEEAAGGGGKAGLTSLMVTCASSDMGTWSMIVKSLMVIFLVLLTVMC